METIDWQKVEELSDKRATRLRKIEHELAESEGLTAEQLCYKIGLSSKAKIRIIQKDINELRGLYSGNQTITFSPYRLCLNGGDLAFPEAEFTTDDRKFLNKVLRLLVLFDGSVPIKEILTLSDGEIALNSMSDSIEASTNKRELNYITDLFDAIANHFVVDISYSKLNNGKVFQFAPYLLKRFNNKWFVIGRMYVSNPFEWTVIPLAAINDLNKNSNRDLKYIPNKESKIKELKQRIRDYYKNVIGFHVPTKADTDQVSHEMNPLELSVDEIRLKFSPEILRYIKENPIHETQTINEETCEVKLNLVINPLLVNRILSFGADVEVLAPAPLINTVKDTIKKMELLYKAN